MHFNHKAMLQLCWRPENFEQRIFSWLQQIPSKDTLICLWDIWIKRDTWVHETFIQPLTCKKILVRWNHDRKSISRYASHGWDFVCDSFTLDWFNKHMLFTHMPTPVQLSHTINIHWHWHQRIELQETISDYNWILYSPELYNYTPIQLRRLLHINKII